MCNLYSMTKGQQAIREIAGAMRDRTGNLPPCPAVFPDRTAPIVRNGLEGRELTLARRRMREEIELWMTAPAEEALRLQRPLADDTLMIVARGGKQDEGGLAA